MTTNNCNPNISRNKGNQTKKIYQLIEYNMRSAFLEKSRSFKKIFGFLDQQFQMLLNVFLLYVQVEVYQIMLKLKC